MSELKWYLRTQNDTFGPETEKKLVEWARLGRIQPGQEVSDDNISWHRVEDMPFLDMRFSIDIGDGNPRGPFNRVAAEALLASGRLPKTSTLVEVREPFPEERPAEPEPPAEPEVKVVEKEVVKEVRVEVPVEKVVEKVIEVPVEKEVVKEVRVEVPVEKIVEKVVEKVVVDETRVKELEGLLDEERRHTADLQAKLDETSRGASEAARAARERESALSGELAAAKERAAGLEGSLRESVQRENKGTEQIKALEDELRRLPQAASEVADIQAAVYSIMSGESEELARIIEQEKREFEDFKKRCMERSDRLQERRRELMKRSGANIEDMTHRALLNRPEDPRTVQLRRELEELRRTHDRAVLDGAEQVRVLSEKLRRLQDEGKRTAEGMKDVAQLQAEVQTLRQTLQSREKDLVAERQRNEELVRQQAARQQTLLARLASLESPSIGTSQTLSTNQSREAKQVRLAGWMRLGR